MKNKLLPAVVGVLGAGALAGPAIAQPLGPTWQPMTSTVSGDNSAPWSPCRSPKPLPSPEQSLGSFTVHLDGRLNWYAGVAGTSADELSPSKLGNTEFQGYIRACPGFDARASNGLQYGVVSEIRNPDSNDSSTGSSASANATANTLYWRRAYGYIGTPDLGQLHFGQGDGAFDLLMVGTFVHFNDGGWKGDVPYFAPSYVDLKNVWPWPNVANYYATNRVVYLSPTWTGFSPIWSSVQFGVSFAPNNNPLINTENCTVASYGCNRVISADFTPPSMPPPGAAAIAPRYRNEADVAGELARAFGPLCIALSLGYINATPVANTMPGVLSYRNLSVGTAGLTVSYKGFKVGGNVLEGQMNGQYYLQPHGGAHALAFIAGGEYSAELFVVGASYFQTRIRVTISRPRPRERRRTRASLPAAP